MGRGDMGGFSYSEASLARLQGVLAWLTAEILTAANLVQIPAVFVTGGLAYLAARPICRFLEAWASGAPPGDSWIARNRDVVVHNLVPLVTPAIWTAGLWIAVSFAQRAGWPHDVARVTANLLLAWLCIRLVADLVPSDAVARLLAVGAWTLAALNILNLLGPLLDLLDGFAFSLGTSRITALTVVKGMLSLALLLWAATFASKLFERRITRFSDLTPRSQVLFGKLLKITLVTLAFVLALTSVGIDLSTFALFTGAIGVGVGLGLQKTVSNLFSGIVLLLDRSIKPGDVIEVGHTYGWVSSLGARYISVETRDGTEYLIPNEDIITHQVLNWSHKSDRVRLKVAVRAPLDSDLDQVMALMREAAAKPARVLKNPAPNPVIIAFAESAIELELRFWIADARNGVQNIKSEVLLETWRTLRENGISVPVPLRHVIVGPAAPDQRPLPENAERVVRLAG